MALTQLLDLPAPAKLNLFLHVVGRRTDGYHLLQTLFRFVGHGDLLHFVPRTDADVVLATPLPGVAPETDLTVRAARLLQSETGCRLGVTISLDKRLPMGGGLGGGSSDAATVLLALNHLWGLGLPLLLLAGILLGWSRYRAEVCGGAERQLGELLGERQRAAIGENLRRTGRGESLPALDALVERFRARWLAEYHEACADTRLRGGQPEESMELRLGCLQEHAAELHTALDILQSREGTLGARAAEQALDTVRATTELAGCRDVPVLRSRSPLPRDPGQRARAMALRSELAVVQVLHDASRYREASERVEQVLVHARAAGFAPMMAEALYHKGRVLRMGGAAAAAEAAYVEALGLAEAGRHDSLVASIFISLVYIVGVQQGRTAQGLELARYANAALRRCTACDSLWNPWRRQLGTLLLVSGDPAAALAHYQQIPDEEAAAAPGHLDLENNRGLAYLGLGRLSEARARFERSLRLRTAQVVAPGHQQADHAERGLRLRVWTSLRLEADVPLVRGAERVDTALGMPVECIGGSSAERGQHEVTIAARGHDAPTSRAAGSLDAGEQAHAGQFGSIGVHHGGGQILQLPTRGSSCHDVRGFLGCACAGPIHACAAMDDVVDPLRPCRVVCRVGVPSGSTQHRGHGLLELGEVAWRPIGGERLRDLAKQGHGRRIAEQRAANLRLARCRDQLQVPVVHLVDDRRQFRRQRVGLLQLPGAHQQFHSRECRVPVRVERPIGAGGHAVLDA